MRETTSASILESVRRGEFTAAAPARPFDRQGAGSRLSEGDGPEAGGSLRNATRALADDIELWLADEPVAAYRERPIERLGSLAPPAPDLDLDARPPALIGISLAAIVGATVIEGAQAAGSNRPQGGRDQLRHGTKCRERLLDERQ